MLHTARSFLIGLWLLLLDLSLKEVHTIHVGMPVDNLSVDQSGDIYAAAFPKILDVVKAFKNAYGKGIPLDDLAHS